MLWRLIPTVLFSLASLARADRVPVVVHVPADTPADAAVYLAGSVSTVGNWRVDGVKLSRQTDGTYTGAIDLGDEVLEYKFNRGSWHSVEVQADGSDQPNRRYGGGTAFTGKGDRTTAAPKIDATVARWKAGPPPSSVVGTLQLHTLASKPLGRPVILRVWLPPGYAADAAARYPVLYLHDGQNCFDRRTAAFGHEWEVDETLTTLIADKTVPPVIIVGIDNGGASRLDDYTFVKDPHHGGGHATAYADCLLNEVRPLIDKTYRTQPDAAHTYLGGSSLGGLVTLDIARHHPGVFGGLLVMSPSLWWAKETTLNDIAHDAKPLAGTRIWLDIGTAEEAGNDGTLDVSRTQTLDAMLTAAHIEHRLFVDPGAHHNEEAWAKRFPAAITYLLNEK